jgi:hypothetical protein
MWELPTHSLASVRSAERVGRNFQSCVAMRTNRAILKTCHFAGFDCGRSRRSPWTKCPPSVFLPGGLELELGIRIYCSDLVDHLDRGRHLDWHDHVGALRVFKIVGSSSGCRQEGAHRVKIGYTTRTL